MKAKVSPRAHWKPAHPPYHTHPASLEIPYAVQGYYLNVTPTSLAYSTQFAVQLTGYTS